MYHTVIFDYGNTLCEMGSIANSLQAVCDSEHAYKIGKTIEQHIQKLYVPNQVIQPEWCNVWEVAFNEHLQKFDIALGLKHLNHFVDSGNLYSYTIPLLEALHNQGTKLVLLSNVTGSTEVFQRELYDRGLSKYFDRIIWSSEIDYRKPSEQSFRFALESTGSFASSTLMVGDNEIADVQGAKAVGISAMLVSDHVGTKSNANYVVSRGNVMSELIRLTS